MSAKRDSITQQMGKAAAPSRYDILMNGVRSPATTLPQDIGDTAAKSLGKAVAVKLQRWDGEKMCPSRTAGLIEITVASSKLLFDYDDLIMLPAEIEYNELMSLLVSRMADRKAIPLLVRASNDWSCETFGSLSVYMATTKQWHSVDRLNWDAGRELLKKLDARLKFTCILLEKGTPKYNELMDSQDGKLADDKPRRKDENQKQKEISLQKEIQTHKVIQVQEESKCVVQ